jgi:hypothetical protein
MKASSQSYTLHSNRPVTRKLHGRLLFVVPQSQISRVWDENHVSGDGLHFTLARTRLNVSHLSWPKKFSDLRSRFASCEACAEALGPKGFPAVELYTGQSARPGSFGEVVFFDTKSYQTRSGRQHLGTSLDKTTGLVKAILIDSPSGTQARRLVEDFLALGKKISIAVFDRHASFLRDTAFRQFLADNGITPYYSKGHNPTSIADLERVHREFNRLIRALEDPWSWTHLVPRFLAIINENPMEALAGATRGGMALGHGPAETFAIAKRFKSWYEAAKDSRPPDAPPVDAGDEALLQLPFQSQNAPARSLVSVLDTTGAKALIQEKGNIPRWVHLGRLAPLSNKAGKGVVTRPPAPVEALPGAPIPDAVDSAPTEPQLAFGSPPRLVSPDAADLDAKYAAVGESALQPAPAEPAAEQMETEVEPIVYDEPPAPRPGQWCVLSNGTSPWFGVVTRTMKDHQVEVHHFRLKEKRRSPGNSLPVWINSKGTEKLQRSAPASSTFGPAAYLQTTDAILHLCDRPDSDLWTLPLSALRAIADFDQHN